MIHLPAIVCACLLPSAAESIPLHGQTVVRFASREEGRAVLGRNDEFIAALSRFDRQARMGSARDVRTEELREFLASQAAVWQPQEQRRVRSALGSIRTRLDALKLTLDLPRTILLVKSTGAEEGQAAYCRQLAIVLPAAKLQMGEQSLERLLVHELFHILSRHNPPLRARMYAVIGFRPGPAVPLPATLRDRKITNPDAPSLEWYLTVEYQGRPQDVVPLLLASAEAYDPAVGGSLFRYLTFHLLAVRQVESRWQVELENGKPLLLNPADVPAFGRQVGRNTAYIIHPEEVLADNFVHLVFQSEQLPDPQIVHQLRRLLTAES